MGRTVARLASTETQPVTRTPRLGVQQQQHTVMSLCCSVCRSCSTRQPTRQPTRGPWSNSELTHVAPGDVGSRPRSSSRPCSSSSSSSSPLCNCIRAGRWHRKAILEARSAHVQTCCWRELQRPVAILGWPQGWGGGGGGAEKFYSSVWPSLSLSLSLCVCVCVCACFLATVLLAINVARCQKLEPHSSRVQWPVYCTPLPQSAESISEMPLGSFGSKRKEEWQCFLPANIWNIYKHRLRKFPGIFNLMYPI